MPILLSFLSSEHSWATQTSAGDFLKAIITISANASQNEQSCIGPNELTRQLVSKPCVEKLIADMLKGGNPLTVGVGIVIEVIRKNNSDYDPDVGAEANSIPSSRDPIYLGTLLRLFSQHVPDFMELILSPNHTIGGSDGGPVTIRRKELSAAFGGRIEPLGFDRFKTCELMAELLHCSNMGLLNEVGSEEFVRARDAERERLRAEGKLGVSHDQSIIADDDLTMKSSVQSHSSPSGSRKLEVQNASDDDGFEEVTHSTDLGDDAKDDFDEKLEGPGEDLLAPVKAPAPLSFLGRDDEDFVDEPLTSPRLNADLDVEPPQLPEAEMTVEPLSPSKDLARDLGSMDVDDTAMTSPPPVNKSEEVESAEDACEKTPGPETSEPATEAVKVGSIEAAGLPEIQEPEGMSPHPDDKPAPLFAKSTEKTTEPEAAPAGGDASGETLDTTMGEAGDNSIVTAHPDTNEHSEEVMPVVGDFLKLQFVEHKVVPTILVRSFFASIYNH